MVRGAVRAGVVVVVEVSCGVWGRGEAEVTWVLYHYGITLASKSSWQYQYGITCVLWWCVCMGPNLFWWGADLLSDLTGRHTGARLGVSPRDSPPQGGLEPQGRRGPTPPELTGGEPR